MMIKSDMQVKIVSIENTKIYHGVNSGMLKMVNDNHQYRVRGLFDNDGGQSCTIAGWTWNCKDLRPCSSKVEPPKVETFDIKNLDI